MNEPIITDETIWRMVNILSGRREPPENLVWAFSQTTVCDDPDYPWRVYDAAIARGLLVEDGGLVRRVRYATR